MTGLHASLMLLVTFALAMTGSTLMEMSASGSTHWTLGVTILIVDFVGIGILGLWAAKQPNSRSKD